MSGLPPSTPSIPPAAAHPPPTPHDPQKTAAALRSVSKASTVTWERNSNMMAKNKYAFTATETPTLFKPATLPSASASAATIVPPETPLQPGSTASWKRDMFASPAIPSSSSGPSSATPLVSATPQLGSGSGRVPVPVGTFANNLWAAYHHPGTNKPYFYCHTKQITTYECPPEIETEFRAQYSLFLHKTSGPKPPIPPPMVLPAIPSHSNSSQVCPPVFSPRSAVGPDGGLSTPRGTATLSRNGTVLPPPLPPCALSRTTSTHSSRTTNSVLATDLPATSPSQTSTVNDLTSPAGAPPNFTFPSHIANPSSLPVKGPAGHRFPTISPPAHATPLSLPSLDKPLSVVPPLTAPARGADDTIPNSSVASNDHLGPANLYDPSVPFSEVLKIEPYAMQCDGQLSKQTAGFRKAWKSRYVILHQGSFRYWDDLTHAQQQMGAPNAIVSIVGCVATLPPPGNGVHPKYGFYIDGQSGDANAVMQKLADGSEVEVVPFFIKTEQDHEVDSWMHVLYRNGIIDGRFVLNPDLSSPTASVQATLQHLFQTWATQSVATETHGLNAPTPSAAALHSHAAAAAGHSAPTTPLGSAAPSTASPSNPFPSHTASTQHRTMKGLYKFGGLYGYQPVPIPVHVNGKKRPLPFFAVLFCDRIELFESYNDANEICKYSNPDTNNTLSPDQLTKPSKVVQIIPLTPKTTLHISRSSHSNGSIPNEHSLKLCIAEHKARKIRPQEVILTFEECNPMTGQSQVITRDSSAPSNDAADTAGTSLSTAQKWFLALQYCIDGPLNGTFSTQLWWSIVRSPLPVPSVLHTCFRFIAQKGLDEEGILRVPGNNQDIVVLRRQFDSCLSSTTVNEPNTAAGLFKLFLRENLDGMIPATFYKEFTSHNCRSAGAGAAPEKRVPLVQALRELVAKLPALNQLCLSYAIYILTRISSHSSTNKMYPKNCAMVIAPNLFRQPVDRPADGCWSSATSDTMYANPQSMAESLAEQEAIVLIMIEHFDEIFLRGSPFTY